MKQRVLVVDDSPQNRLVATGHLETAGYEVVAVESGEKALDLLAREKVDLVVLDVLMPGIGGFETCRRIRATTAIADTPVLFLTALGDREATGPAIEAGGDDLLPKPFHRSELLLRARALIRQRQTTAELRQALEALAAQNETLRRAEHDKRRISELIVHDLKGPITAMIANVDLLARKARPEQAEMLSDIRVAAQSLERTAKDLLDLSVAEETTLTVHRERFALAELVEEVAAAMRGIARWTEIEIATQVFGEEVFADRELMRRIVQNLVHNAVKHAPQRTQVTVEARVDAEVFTLRVTDRGPGVPPADVERIFERFVTLEDAPSRSGSHGLGLAFCRLAAEAHGGAIWVEPASETGAAFCLRIPQTPA